MGSCVFSILMSCLRGPSAGETCCLWYLSWGHDPLGCVWARPVWAQSVPFFSFRPGMRVCVKGQRRFSGWSRFPEPLRAEVSVCLFCLLLFIRVAGVGRWGTGRAFGASRHLVRRSGEVSVTSGSLFVWSVEGFVPEGPREGAGRLGVFCRGRPLAS